MSLLFPPAQFPLSNCAQCVAITGLGVKGCTAAEPLVLFSSSSNVLKLELTKDLSLVWRTNAWIVRGANADPKVGPKQAPPTNDCESTVCGNALLLKRNVYNLARSYTSRGLWFGQAV